MEPKNDLAAAITLGHERPLRMAVRAASAPAPLIDAPARTSVVSYAAAIQFDWRRDVPMAAPKSAEDKAA